MASAYDRPVGQYPLSIATSLALEGFYGVHPDLVNIKDQSKDFKQMWVNLRTLFRNFYNAIGKDDYAKIRNYELKSAFLQEIGYLKSVVQQLSPDIKVVIYLSEYKDLHLKFRHASLRDDTTDNQLMYTKALKDMIKYVFEQDEDKLIKKYDFLIDNISEKAVMITHAPVDLFVKYHNGLWLLESHTGNLKGKASWNTKYMNGKTLSQMPYRLDFLTIFGDSETFRPGLMPYKKALIDLSIKHNWTPLTTYDKILLGINSLTDKFLAVNLKAIITKT